MNRRAVAGILTVGVLGLMLGLGGRRRAEGPGGPLGGAIAPEPTPEDRLRTWIESARAGDVDGYLDAFAEPVRSRVAREAEEAGRPAFADALRRASKARKGYALHAAEPDGPDAVRIVMESVYPDRNVRQAYRLRRDGGSWRIAAIEEPRGREPAARFGTPATYQAPEGVPVQGVEPPDPSESPGP